jgi:hypothetical protein
MALSKTMMDGHWTQANREKYGILLICLNDLLWPSSMIMSSIALCKEIETGDLRTAGSSPLSVLPCCWHAVGHHTSTHAARTYINTLVRPQGQTVFQGVSSGHVKTSWQASWRTFSTCDPHVSSWLRVFLFPKTLKASCNNDYRPLTLTSVIMKCFERLVMAYLNSIIPDPL